ncbi:hypothetical protein RSO41_12590 [Halomonas sp. I1]|uniref:phage tail fiber protein n=1 Tax=Halomonas sp. I1 TaxID=393536 RepID=UPI0028DE1487|nr:hypothetical protein [Halomonas sp. I1]MDT8895494.1 hypothetical protein [Halomonas sp. I1]
MATEEQADAARQALLEQFVTLEQRARDLVKILTGGIDVGQSGTLGDLALLSTLSSAPVGDVQAFRDAINFGGAALVEMREYGLGSIALPDYPLSDMEMDPRSVASGLYRAGVNVSNRPGSVGTVEVRRFNSENVDLVYVQTVGGLTLSRSYSADGWRDDWDAYWTQKNTTIDSNGFIKEASPIFRLANLPSTSRGAGFADAGAGMANAEAQGVSAEHIETGVYRVTGSLGLATDGWQIELPQDPGTGQHLIMAQTSWDAEAGVLTVRTFNRQFDINTASIVPGDPTDIPDGRWLDLRLEMPEPENPEEETTP